MLAGLLVGGGARRWGCGSLKAARQQATGGIWRRSRCHLSVKVAPAEGLWLAYEIVTKKSEKIGVTRGEEPARCQA